MGIGLGRSPRLCPRTSALAGADTAVPWSRETRGGIRETPGAVGGARISRVACGWGRATERAVRELAYGGPYRQPQNKVKTKSKTPYLSYPGELA